MGAGYLDDQGAFNLVSGLCILYEAQCSVHRDLGHPAIWQPCGSLKLEQGRVYEVAGSRPHCSLQPVPPILMSSVWWVELRYVAIDGLKLHPDGWLSDRRDNRNVARFLCHHRSYWLSKLTNDFIQRRSSIASAVNVPST
jgi:hypothetical protein